MKRPILYASVISTTVITAVSIILIISARNKSGCNGTCVGCSACGNKQVASTYYVQNESKLKKAFVKKQEIFEPLLRSYYTDSELKQIIAETSNLFNNLIPDIPYIGGKKNPRTEDIENAAMVLAFYKVQKKYGRTTEEIGTIIYKSIEKELDKYPKWILHLIGGKFFTKNYVDLEKLNAANSQLKQYPYDWVTVFVDGEKDQFDYGCDHIECGIYKFLTDNKAEDIVPYLCQLDYLYSNAFGEGLVRTSNLAEDGTPCNFRFKRE